MPIEADVIYKTSDVIVAEMIADMQSRVSDVWVEEDGNIRMLYETFAAQVSGVYLALQVMRDNIFIQTANLVELRMKGEEVGELIKPGVHATGTLLFSGKGGQAIDNGSLVAIDPGVGDVLYYETIADGTIPNPGDPTAPVTADGGGSGNLVAGTYEYTVSFVTADGETLPSPESTGLTLAASHKTNLTSIPIGGTGTISRKIYRSKNGGAYLFVHTLADNTTTTYTDNIIDASLGGSPLSASTAERVSIAAQAEEAGTEYNCAIGVITELADVNEGVNDVINTTTFSGGTDEEATEAYRSRLLSFVRNPKTGSLSDLEGWAVEVDGVEGATAFPNDNEGTPTNGHVTVRIFGPGGSVPVSDVVDAVQALLESKDLANVTIHTDTFSAHTLSPTVDVTTDADTTLDDVTPSVVAAVTDCINSTPVGGTVYKAGIIKCAMEVNGVINVTTTFTDTTSTATQKPVAGTVTVS